MEKEDDLHTEGKGNKREGKIREREDDFTYRREGEEGKKKEERG